MMTLDEALYDISASIKNAGDSSETIALVDGRPGRMVSLLFQQFAAAVPHGKYIAYGDASLDLLASMVGKPKRQFAYDLDHAQTILSFGVPLCDSWGAPERTARYLEKKSEAKQNIIQVETYQSRTAGMADRWIPLLPGTDAVFALGVAHVILNEKLFNAQLKDLPEIKTYVSSFSPSTVAEICGVSEEAVMDTARVFAARLPSVAVIDGLINSRYAETAVMVLNLLVGSVGRKGGIIVQREVPTGFTEVRNADSIHSDLYSIPDHSIRVMIIDESLSGCQLSDTLMQKKLADNGVIVSLSPFVTERSFSSQYIIPTPVFLESLTDLPSSYDREVSSMSISSPLVPAPTGVVDPIQFIQRLAETAGIRNIESGTMEELLKKRLGALYNEKRGSVFNPSNGQIIDVKSLLAPEDLWNALIAGGCWMDAAESMKSVPAFHLTTFLKTIDINKLKSQNNPLMLVPFIERTAYSSSEISPLMSKVGQESGLRPYACQAYLNPKTAGGYSIPDGCRILLQTTHGSMQAEAYVDDSLMPGIVRVSNTMNPQSLIALCELNDDGSICPTTVKIQKV
jgi:anaerobic selenocysteine-containing dehydrogenase